ncbi:hypothetical protein QM876_00505 [Streptococcus timonensis]|uniref:hypothetical protein n=1 Tax=Streptococcus timonensis TaxID=1852387 RepID=UPI0039C2F046
MLKSNKWIFLAISVPFMILALSYLFIRVPIGNTGKFIHDHEDSIKREIIADIDSQGQYIKSVTLLPGSARGGFDNGGDVGGNYHISFTAYANNNRKQSMKVELVFPDAGIGPFTFIKPNPYKSPETMRRWYLSVVEVSSDPSWDWKRKQDKLNETMNNLLDFAVRKGKDADWQVRKEIMIRFLNKWLHEHEENFKLAIQTNLYRNDPELEQKLGKIQSISVSNYQMYIPSRGSDIRFDVRFERYPEEIATINVRLHSQGEQSVFKDPSVAATISFENERFAIKTNYDSKLFPIFNQSRFGNSNGEISYKLPKDYENQFLIP